MRYLSGSCYNLAKLKLATYFGRIVVGSKCNCNLYGCILGVPDAGAPLHMKRRYGRCKFEFYVMVICYNIVATPHRVEICSIIAIGQSRKTTAVGTTPIKGVMVGIRRCIITHFIAFAIVHCKFRKGKAIVIAIGLLVILCIEYNKTQALCIVADVIHGRCKLIHGATAYRSSYTRQTGHAIEHHRPILRAHSRKGKEQQHCKN